jgi:general secretion pathway protein D
MQLRALAPWLAVGFALGLAGCGARPIARNEGHVQTEARAPTGTSQIPQPVRSVPMPPPPEARETEIRYSVVVANQPVRDVLLAMARETKVNFDIHPGVEGTINLNAIDQTLKQILTRIARQIDMRWEMDGQTLTVMPDTPYLRTYKVDYVNMARDVTGTIGVQSQVVSPPLAGSTATANTSQNSSLLRVDNNSKNRFWETLEKNVKDLLRETDKQLPEGSSETVVQARGQAPGTTRTAVRGRNLATGAGTNGAAASVTTTTPADTPSQSTQEFTEQRLTFREAASVIVNPESGIVTVRATSRQQEKVAEFLNSVISAARRQILIEATVVEVQLSDRYQSGVDWSALGLQGLGYSFTQSLISGTGTLTNTTNPFFSVEYKNPNAASGGSISSTVKLLDQFGNTRVLSSPRLMAINNQTAVLKVVDNLVYFTVDVTPATISSSGSVTSPATVKTTPQLVPVGFVMNVTPQVSDSDMVVLNVRPTITSKIGEVRDPNPELARVNQTNLVPIIRSREFESVLRIPSGNTAILGGLMEDKFEGNRGGLPVLSRIPFFGDAVSFRDDTSSKRELVIFLRPIVVRDASLDGDLAEYRRYLPGPNFFPDERIMGQKFDEQIDQMRRYQSTETSPSTDPSPQVPPPSGGRP